LMNSVRGFYKFYEDGDPVDVYYYVDRRTTENSWTYHLNSAGDTLTLRLPEGPRGVRHYLGEMQNEINRVQGSNNSVYQYFLERNVVLPTQVTHRVQVKPGKLSDWQIEELESKKTAVFNFWVKGKTARDRVQNFFGGFNLSEKDYEGQNYFDNYLERLLERLWKLNDIVAFAAGEPDDFTEVDVAEARYQRKIHTRIIDTKRLVREKKTELKGPYDDEEYSLDFYEIHVSHSDTMALLFEETENAGAEVIQWMEKKYKRPFTHYHTVKVVTPLYEDIVQKTTGRITEIVFAIATFEFKIRSTKEALKFQRILDKGDVDAVLDKFNNLFNTLHKKQGWEYKFDYGSDIFSSTIQKETDYYWKEPLFEMRTEEIPIGIRIVVPDDTAVKLLRGITTFDNFYRPIKPESETETDASAKPAPKNKNDKFNSKKAIPVAIPKKVVIPVPAKIPVVSKKDKRDWRF